MSKTPFSTIEAAVADVRAGKMVVVCDDEDRENEGDLTLAAQFATPDAINFMATHGRGLICLALTPERCELLGLDLMAARNQSRYQTAFTVSVDAREGISTGISAHDRARTIAVAIDPRCKPSDLVRPGHMFPLKAKPGGVLERTGQTEASVDLARLAGLRPAAVICEVLNDDGTMARVPDLERYCAVHGLKMVTVADLISYRQRHERLVERVVATDTPTKFGSFDAIGYRSLMDGKHHIAMVKGDVRGEEDVLVRVHSACLTGDASGSLLCDCGLPLDDPLGRIEEEERGVVLYLAREGRGIGLLNRLKAYNVAQPGFDHPHASFEPRSGAEVGDYRIGADILGDLGLSSVRLLTNSPSKVAAFERSGLRVTGRVAVEQPSCDHIRDYLRAKASRRGHTLQCEDGDLGDDGRPQLELVAQA